MVELSDFVPHAPVPAEIVEEYRGRVPDELVEIWEQYGYGTFGEGFLRIIDPLQYETEIGHCIGKTQGDGITIPIMTTGLGDLITWEPSLGLVAIQYRLGRTYGLGTRMRSALRLIEDGLILSRLGAEIFPKAVALHGEPAYEESFIFVPLLSMGGQAKVQNLHKRKTIASIQVAADTQGVIGRWPCGSRRKKDDLSDAVVAFLQRYPWSNLEDFTARFPDPDTKVRVRALLDEAIRVPKPGAGAAVETGDGL